MTVLRDAVNIVYDLLRRRDDPVRVTLAHTLKGHTNWIRSVAFLPDGDYLFSGSFDGTVGKWRVSDGSAVGETMKHERAVNAIFVSPDGKVVASGGVDGKIVFWSSDTCEKKAEAQDIHADWIRSLSFAPESQTVASGSNDGSIMLWNALTGERIAELRDHNGGVASVAFSPSGDKLAASEYFAQGVLIWDVSAGEVIGPPIRLSVSFNVRSVVWSLDSRQLICGDYNGAINFLDSSDGTLLATCRDHTKPIWSMALSHDGTILASAAWDRTVRLWSTSTHQQLASLRHPKVMDSVSISPDGRYLASGCNDGKLRIWQVQDVPSQEDNKDPAASSTDPTSALPQHVSSDDPEHTKAVDHPTTANDEADDDDQPESSVAGESDRPNMTTANDSYLDLPAVLPSRAAVDDGVHTQLFDLGDLQVSQPNVNNDTRRGRWKKKAKESRQYLSQQIKHFREGMLPRHGASDMSGAARPPSSQKLKDRISRIRRRTSLAPENDEDAAQDEGSEESRNNKGKTPKLKSVLVAANRLRQVLVVAAPPRHVEQEKWYFVKRDGKLVRVPGPSTQPCAQGSSQLIAGRSNVASIASGGQAQGQSQRRVVDMDINLCGCSAWIKR